MRTILVCALLFGAMALFSTPETLLLAQDKKKDKDKAGAGIGMIEISEGKDGKFRFTIRDADGKFLANSGANNFASEKEARAGVDEFRAVVAKAKVALLPKKADDKDKKTGDKKKDKEK